jgi:hypothetical protein
MRQSGGRKKEIKKEKWWKKIGSKEGKVVEGNRK